MTAFPAPAAQAPRITPGALARVRPDAESPYAGRSGLVVALDGDIATLRFGAVRTYVFALSDLIPVVAFATGRRR